jgi:hypothetical protein
LPELLVAVLGAAWKANPWIDQDRLGVSGGHTNRFKAAVTLRSVPNFISDDGTRDGAYGDEDDFKGFLFEKFDQYWNASPLKSMKSMKNPPWCFIPTMTSACRLNRSSSRRKTTTSLAPENQGTWWKA